MADFVEMRNEPCAQCGEIRFFRSDEGYWMCPYGHLRMDIREELQEEGDAVAASGNRMSTGGRSRLKTHRLSAIHNRRRPTELTPQQYEAFVRREARLQRHGDIDKFALLEGLQQLLRHQLAAVIDFDPFWRHYGQFMEEDAVKRARSQLEQTAKTVWLSLVEGTRISYWHNEEPTVPPKPSERIQSKVFHCLGGRPFDREINLPLTLLTLYLALHHCGVPVLLGDMPRLVLTTAVPYTEAWRLLSWDLWTLRLHHYQRRFFQPKHVPVDFFEHLPAFLGRLGAVSRIPDVEADLSPLISRLMRGLRLDQALLPLIERVLIKFGPDAGVFVRESASASDGRTLLTGSFTIVKGFRMVMPGALVAVACIVVCNLLTDSVLEAYESKWAAVLAYLQNLPLSVPGKVITDDEGLARLLQVAYTAASDLDRDFSDDLASFCRDLGMSKAKLDEPWSKERLFEEFFCADAHTSDQAVVEDLEDAVAATAVVVSDAEESWPRHYRTLVQLAGFLCGVPADHLHALSRHVLTCE